MNWHPTCSTADSLAAIQAARAADREFVLVGHEGPLLDFEFASAGKRLASASLDGMARIWDLTIWDLATSSFLPLDHGGDGPALVTFQPNGGLVVGGMNGLLQRHSYPVVTPRSSLGVG